MSMSGLSAEELRAEQGERSSSFERCNLATGDNDVIYTTEPLPFIQSVSNGKLVVSSRARDLLSRIEKPLIVISIAGLYRTGMCKH